MKVTADTYRQTRRAHWDAVARRAADFDGLGGAYHRRLNRLYAILVAPGQRVLELGCGEGDLLAAVHPSFGVGVDLSGEMLARARQRHPHLQFIESDVQQLALEGTFDVVILSDLVNDLWDVQAVLERIRPYTTPRTRIVLNFYSKLWQPPLDLARKMGLADPLLEQNWLAVEDVRNLLMLSGYEVIRHQREVLWPVWTPGIDTIFNRFLVKVFPLNHLALTNIMVARPVEEVAHPASAVREDTRAGAAPTVSVIVPARNEEGNVPAIMARIPEMGGGTEIVFVEGGSRDNTWGAIEREMALHPERKTKLLRQTGVGKGDAVRLGFREASGDVLMILDADLTVPPEDLPRFFEAIRSNKAEFVNGVRLVYPMEERSMQFLNQIANKLFGWVFTFLLGQPIRDTLCGTKVLRKSDYERIAANRAYFGEFDPFGDFDLLFGAARQNLKIVDLPVRYQERTYGTTNISRFKHGWMLLKMTLIAARKLKFV